MGACLFGGRFVGGFSQAGFLAGGRFPVHNALFGGLVNARFSFFQVFFKRSGFRFDGGGYGFGGQADFFRETFVSGGSLFGLALRFDGARVSTSF